MTPQEPDYPPGHPARFDYDPASPEAVEWMRVHSAPLGERDFPVGHPKAIDTPGNTNAVPVRAGVDPAHPELEAFTGRTPEVAARMREINLELARAARETVPPEPTEAPPPPKPIHILQPAGQPGS